MNKSVKIYVPAINEAFYKNVFLLTQLVPPSAEFQRHFKQVREYIQIQVERISENMNSREYLFYCIAINS